MFVHFSVWYLSITLQKNVGIQFFKIFYEFYMDLRFNVTIWQLFKLFTNTTRMIKNILDDF
jgi:hypothetical protein